MGHHVQRLKVMLILMLLIWRMGKGALFHISHQALTKGKAPHFHETTTSYPLRDCEFSVPWHGTVISG